MEVLDALPEKVDHDAGEVNGQTAPGWVTAALDGIRATLAYARRANVVVTGCRAMLNKIVGTTVDTRDDVVRCAAGLAVWDALGSPVPPPDVKYDGDKWDLDFPAPIPTPVHGRS